MKVVPKKRRQAEHGSLTRRRQCSCFKCRLAHARYKSEWRKGVRTNKGVVSTLIPVRQLRALAVHGWSTTHISNGTGIPIQSLQAVMCGRWKALDRQYVTALSAFYFKHEATLGPNKNAASKARGKGWFGPFDWDDINDPTEVPYRDKKGYIRRRWLVGGTETNRDQGSSPAA